MTEPDSPAAWQRLALGLAIGSIGCIGFWSYVVALPAVQAGFGVTRAEASLPYTLTMVGFAFGGIAMGWLSDRFGIFVPIALGGTIAALAYVLAGLSPSITWFALAQAMLGFGASACFAPLMSDISHWFERRRGLAVTIVSSGNYIAGAVWPPILQAVIEEHGWRVAHFAMAALCLATILPLALTMRRPAPAGATSKAPPKPLRGLIALPPNALLVLLCFAGLSCCIAMSMPQVHLVAYCADLGYGPARGAQMLSLMLALGIVSRVLSGLVADRVGGLVTLLIGSAAQALALFLYMAFDGLTSLFLISALFGLFQGGIIPMYAVIVRDYFPAGNAGSYLGIIIMATLFGMAFGGWLSGAIFDWTGSYRAAFLNGLVWNLANLAIVCLMMARRRPAPVRP